jgi:hypothetical protein
LTGHFNSTFMLYVHMLATPKAMYSVLSFLGCWFVPLKALEALVDADGVQCFEEEI